MGARDCAQHRAGCALPLKSQLEIAAASWTAKAVRSMTAPNNGKSTVTRSRSAGGLKRNNEASQGVFGLIQRCNRARGALGLIIGDVMGVAVVFFYVFAAIMIASALAVISARNPVHSVLFLILAFFNAAGLFLLAGAEFLAIILIVVYVGAVMVLFLFVVMMLDVDFTAMRQGMLQYAPVAILIGIVLAVELVGVLATGVFAQSALPPAAPIPESAAEMSNVRALGTILYTDYVFFFQLAGMILLVAMIGAIVLTLRQREGIKRQDIGAQNARSREASVELRDVESGKGI